VVNGFANIDQVGNPMSFAQPSFDPACAFREVLEHAPAAESHTLVAWVDGFLRFADSPARRPPRSRRSTPRPYTAGPGTTSGPHLMQRPGTIFVRFISEWDRLTRNLDMRRSAGDRGPR
jgi:hypothetical protein